MGREIHFSTKGHVQLPRIVNGDLERIKEDTDQLLSMPGHAYLSGDDIHDVCDKVVLPPEIKASALLEYYNDLEEVEHRLMSIHNFEKDYQYHSFREVPVPTSEACLLPYALSSIPSKPGVYFLWEENPTDGPTLVEISYIGRSDNLKKRVTKYHEKIKHLIEASEEFGYHVYLTFLVFDRQESFYKEAEYIGRFRPRLNFNNQTESNTRAFAPFKPKFPGDLL